MENRSHKNGALCGCGGVKRAGCGVLSYTCPNALGDNGAWSGGFRGRGGLESFEGDQVHLVSLAYVKRFLPVAVKRRDLRVRASSLSFGVAPKSVDGVANPGQP